MLKRIVASLALLLASSRASALDWDHTDTAVQLAYTGLCVVDLLQTSSMAGPHRTAYELNPLIGRTPSHAEVDAWLLGSLAVHWGVALALPRPYRRAFQVVTMSVKASMVGYNLAVGINFTTPW